MDLFFNLFATAPVESRTELDSEVVQLPLDFDDHVGQQGYCLVA